MENTQNTQIDMTNPDTYPVITCPVSEQETIIQQSRSSPDTWTIYTSDNTFLTKMKRMVRTAPDNYQLSKIQWLSHSEGTVSGYFFTVKKDLISLRSGHSAPMSDELKEKKAAILQQGREKKQV